MALSILDGNQSATTLSTILSSGQHITAHTVVSLGTQAITDITSAVSGTSVCVGAISISGTPSVTGSVSVLNFPASQSTTFGAVTGSVSVLNFPASQSVTFGATTGSISVLNFPASQAVTFSAVSISSLPAISGTVTANINDPTTTVISNQIGDALFGSDQLISNLNSLLAPTNNIPISGTVTAGNLPISPFAGVDAQLMNDEGNAIGIDVPFLISSFNNQNIPISGVVTVSQIQTVTAGSQLVATTKYPTAFVGYDVTNGAWQAVPLSEDGDCVIVGNANGAFESNNLLPISGTVTLGAGTDQIGSVTASISGTVPISISSVTVGNSVTIGSLPAISGTVTANAGTGTFVISDKGATGEGTITSFTSTSSAVLKASNSNRKLLTVFNEGNGTIFILLGSGTASTTNYSLRLLSGDYYELEKYTGEVNAIFSAAGTAKITEIT
jgi:hypothetical protein